MEERPQNKMKKGWARKKQSDVVFECSLGPDFWDGTKEKRPRSANNNKVTESQKYAKEAATNVPYEDTEGFEKRGDWIEEGRILEDLGERTKEAKTSEEIRRNTNTQSETKTERPKSLGSFRHSMTPLRIRDNLNRYFRPHHHQESQGQNKEKNLFQKQNMAAIQKEVRNLGNVPCSRIGFPHYSQCIVFDFQLRDLRGPNKDYALYYDWLLWCERGNGQDQKELNLDRVIETKLDLKMAMKYLKPMLGINYSKFHFFKTTAAPKRKSPAFIGSCTLEFMVPSGFEYDMLKETVDVVTSGALYKPQHMHRKCYFVLSK